MQGVFTIQEKGVGFVEEKDGIGVFGFSESPGDGLLRAANPHRQEIRGPLLDELVVEGISEVAGELGFALARKAMEEEIHRESIRLTTSIELFYGPENRLWGNIRVEHGRVVGACNGDWRRLSPRDELWWLARSRERTCSRSGLGRERSGSREW